MQIKEEKAGRVNILSIIGRVEMVHTTQLRTDIFAKIDNSEFGLLLDLSNLDYINSMGLGIFIRSAKLMDEKKRRLVFCSIKENILEVFEIAGFTSILKIYDSKEKALESFPKDSST